LPQPERKKTGGKLNKNKL